MLYIHQTAIDISATVDNIHTALFLIFHPVRILLLSLPFTLPIDEVCARSIWLQFVNHWRLPEVQYFDLLIERILVLIAPYFVPDVKRSIELLEKLQMSGEIPATKLIALQKVLQSEFMNAVREVYEHVYETVDIQGSQDVRASATAKATVAAFAASEGHAHPRVVELPKTDEGIVYNISIVLAAVVI